MSALSKLVDAPGIMGACGGQQGALDFVFGEHISPSDSSRWREIFKNLMAILALAHDHDEVKVVLGNYSIVMRSSGPVYVGVVALKGHSVVKSLQRMVRRAFKHFGAPLHERRHLSVVPPTPTSPTPTSWTSSSSPAPVPGPPPFDPHKDPKR